QATSVGDAHRRGAPDGDDTGARGQQDADLRLAFLAALCGRVIVRKDALLVPAVKRVPVCAPLAHADSVPPAVTGDDERRAGECCAVAAHAGAAIQGTSSPEPHEHADSRSTSKAGQTGE